MSEPQFPAENDSSSRCPSLCLLDLNVPINNGFEVLRHLRESKRCAHVPLVVMSFRKSSRDRTEMERLGANTYFHKPLSYDDFLQVGELISRLLAH